MIANSPEPASLALLGLGAFALLFIGLLARPFLSRGTGLKALGETLPAFGDITLPAAK